MKHRGRHRRRRRSAALRAVLAGTALALTATATLISTSQAEVTEGSGALKPLTSPADTGRFRLREHLVPARALDRLAAGMGRPVGVDAVLASADRTLRPADDCTAEDRASLPLAPAAARAYCWDPADTAAGWRPASVTVSGDGTARGAHRVVLAGWTHGAATGGRGLARVAFVDADDPAHLAYRSALLVVPVDGGRDYRGLVSDVSGMAWYRDKLLVTTTTGTADALYVYDLHRIQRTTVDAAAVGRVSGGWSADGHRFVLPAIGSYRFASGRCAPSGPPCPGALALDGGTGPGSLVAAERTEPGSDRTARLWRYALNADPARPGPLATDARGRADAVEAYRTRASGIRGVLSYRKAGADRPSWYVGRLPDPQDGHGGLWRQDTERGRAAHCGADASDRCWARGAGSLSYAPGTGEVWSLSDRMLFTLPLAALDRSLD